MIYTKRESYLGWNKHSCWLNPYRTLAKLAHVWRNLSRNFSKSWTRIVWQWEHIIVKYLLLGLERVDDDHCFRAGNVPRPLVWILSFVVDVFPNWKHLLIAYFFCDLECWSDFECDDVIELQWWPLNFLLDHNQSSQKFPICIY